MTRSVRSVRAATAADRWVEVTWDDGASSRFHHVWLRDNCPQLRHPTTDHRVVETSSIDPDIAPRAVTVDDGRLAVDWHDGHRSRFEPEWLAAHDYSAGAGVPRPDRVRWRGGDLASLPSASWPEVRDSADACRAFLRGFLRYGVAFLRDVPSEPGTVLSVADRFGIVRPTSWGTVFDVQSIPDANSVAFTNLGLVTHTDEAYRFPSPTIQLQHFLRVDSTGGEATLVDGVAVAEDLRDQDPAAFELLAGTSLHFHFRDETAVHEHVGPTILVDPDGEITQVRWSNHSVRPFLMPFDRMDDYYAAYRRFATLRESPQYRVQVPMGAGDLYMVDNHRVLHGRTAFSAQGARHLQSCYIERDELASRLAVLDRDAAAQEGSVVA